MPQNVASSCARKAVGVVAHQCGAPAPRQGNWYGRADSVQFHLDQFSGSTQRQGSIAPSTSAIASRNLADGLCRPASQLPSTSWLVLRIRATSRCPSPRASRARRSRSGNVAPGAQGE